MRSQVTTSWAVPPGRAARAKASSARAEAGLAERGAALVGDRDAVGVEDLGEELARGAAAHQHGDVLGGHAVAQQLQHGGADELGLGAFAARFEQAHGAVGRDAAARRLEQPALEVVQGAAGALGVVLAARFEREVLAGQRLEQLDGGGAAGERGAAGLVRHRDRQLRVGVADERLHEVQLGGQQLVEAVQEERAAVPRLPRGVQGQVGKAVGVDGLQRLQAGVVGRVQRGELAGVGRRVLSPTRGRPWRSAPATRATAAAPRTGPRARRRSRARGPRPSARATRRRRPRRGRPARGRAAPAAGCESRRPGRGRASGTGTSSPRPRTRAPRPRARGRSAWRRPTSARPAQGRAGAPHGGARGRRPPWRRWPGR